MRCLQRINISDHKDKLPENSTQQTTLKTGHTCKQNNIWKHFRVVPAQNLN